jgi:hypothetical protein
MMTVVFFIFGWYSTMVGPQRWLKEEWREASQHLTSHTRSDDLLVLRVLQIAVPFQYYTPGSTPQKVLQVNQAIGNLEGMTTGHGRVWLVYWNPGGDNHLPVKSTNFDPAAEQDDFVASWLRGAGPRLLERVDFRGVTILCFDLGDGQNQGASNARLKANLPSHAILYDYYDV